MNEVHMIEDDESQSSDISGFSSCSEKFEDLPDGLTEEVYVAEMMRRDAYYAERRIRKNRERGIEQQQQQQQRSIYSAGVEASQDGEGGRSRGEHQQPSDEMDVENSSSVGGSSLSRSEGRDTVIERQRREYNRLQEAHLQQQQRSIYSAGVAASQDGEGGHSRGEHQQPSDEMDAENSSSVGGSSLSRSEGRDTAMERQRREYNRLQEAHLNLLLLARQRLQQQEMKDDVSQHKPERNQDDEYGMGEQPKQQQEVHGHSESGDSSNFSKGAYKRQIEEYQRLQKKHRQNTASASSAVGVSGSQHGEGSCPSSNYAEATSQSGSEINPEAQYTKDHELFDQTAGSKGSAKYANEEEEEEEKDSKMPSEPRYYLATTSQNAENTVSMTCTHCNGNLYRPSNQYGTYVCQICRGLMSDLYPPQW